MAEDDTSSGRYSRPPSYPLSSTHREYISSGETGSYREAKLEQDVQQKVDQLGERFNRLFSDVELLYENGYLDEEQYVDAWIDLLGFDEDDEWGEVLQACHLQATAEGARPTSAPQEVAREFGQLLFMMMLFPSEMGDDELEVMAKELAWGFLHGLYLDPLDGAPLGNIRREAVEETIDYLEDRLEAELEHDERVIDFHEEWRERIETSKEAEQKIYDRIREVLGEIEGLQPQELTPVAFASGDYSHGIDPRDVYRLLIDHLTEDPSPEEDGPGLNNDLGTAGQEALFERQYGPVDELDLDEIVTRENVIAVVSKFNLETKDQIGAMVYEDVQEVTEAGWKGVDVFDVVGEIYQADSSLRSATIAQEIATDSHQGAVTAICNCLAGRKELAGRVWERPIVTGDTDGWELTAYGRFVAKELAARERRKSEPRGLESLEFTVGVNMYADDVADRVAEAADEIGVEMWERKVE